MLADYVPLLLCYNIISGGSDLHHFTVEKSKLKESSTVFFILARSLHRYMYSLASMLTYWGRGIFKCTFLNENVCISIEIKLKFIPECPVNDIPALVQIMAWRRPMTISLLTHLYVTRLQWVKGFFKGLSLILLHRTFHIISHLVKILSREMGILRVFFIILKHDDVIKWKYFPRYWPFVRGIHRSPVNSPHKCQWRGALMFPLICVWINGWVNNGEAGDLRHYRAHYDVTVMIRWHGSVR